MLRSSVLVLATLPACMVGYGSDQGSNGAEVSTGNGSISGTHYNLNIIGMDQGKTANMTTGGRIFVELYGTTKILLSESDFAVLDANGTDGTASFQLPSPDPTGTGQTTYTVYARALGTPGGSSITTTCATDPTTGEVVCSTDSMVLVRDGGTSKFTNVSKDLLFITAVIGGKTQTVSLFDSQLQDYFWSYDNNGLRVAQLRFYMNTN